MKAVDVMGFLFPRFTRNWLAERRMLDGFRTYDAAQSSQWRPVATNLTSGDGVMNVTNSKLRQIARHLDENHDIVVGLLDDLVNNTVGAGVQCAPMVRVGPGGELDEELNDRIGDLWQRWCDRPETTGDLGFEAMERIVVRAWLRDGEQFAQHVVNATAFRYAQRDIPYALELLEADMVPFDYQVQADNILHGIQCNDWNAPVAYFVYLNHPGDPLMRFNAATDLKRIPATAMMHLKFTRRVRQRRGVPILHAVLTRLQDIKDYEESERIAARVAADLTWFIKRTGEYNGPTTVNSDYKRTMQMSAGAGFELLPGEDVGTIKSDRPNSALESFRDSMLRAVAAGTGTRFSSIARNYNGTYSAQRQELVEGAVAYRALFAYLVRRFYQPVYRQFVNAAVIGGALKFTNAQMDSMYRADFRAPALPWIDPAKEATAWQTLIDAGLESRQEIMRQRGRDPAKVWEELEQEKDSGLFASDVEKGIEEMPKDDNVIEFGEVA